MYRAISNIFIKEAIIQLQYVPHEVRTVDLVMIAISLHITLLDSVTNIIELQVIISVFSGVFFFFLTCTYIVYRKYSDPTKIYF